MLVHIFLKRLQKMWSDFDRSAELRSKLLRGSEIGQEKVKINELSHL